MTYEEAIDFAEKLKNNYTIDFNDIESFCDLSIKALQKQVPSKPITTFFEGTVHICPKCSRILTMNEMNEMCVCGQRINWEGVK